MKLFELVVAYDHDLGALNLADFETENDCLFLGKRSTDYLVIFYAGAGNKPYFKKSKLARMSKDELCDLAFSMNLLSGYSFHYRKVDVIEILMGVTNREFYEWHFENEHWHDLDHDFVVRGYCQGDAIAVKEVGGRAVDKTYLQNLFFDSPVFARLQVFEVEASEYLHQANSELIEEIDLVEYLDDSYNYDKARLLELFAENYQGEMKETIVAYLNENLPNEPAYY